MRLLLATALAAGLALAAAEPARAQNDARAVIDNAIKAHGGADALNRFKASRLKARGTLTLNGVEVTVTSESLWQLPDRYKNTLQFDVQGQHFVSTQAVVGDRVSVRINGADANFPDPLKEELRQAAYVQSLTQLTPLLSDGAFTLTPLGESRAAELTLVGVRVARQGRRDVDLFFDKRTGLLTKIERTALDPKLNEGRQATILTDYRLVDGVQLPSRSVVMRDGKRQLETVITEQKLLDRLDDRDFAD
jgi:hypothetical protein